MLPKQLGGRALRSAAAVAKTATVSTKTAILAEAGVAPVKTSKGKVVKPKASAATSPSGLFKHGTLPRTFEQGRYSAGFTHVCGVDEAGRGPLAGPVVAAACIIPATVSIEGIHDSKKLNEEEREVLFEKLTTTPGVVYATAIVDHKEIDSINILQASMRAMERAVAALSIAPECVYVDGPYVPAGLQTSHGDRAVALVKGDSRCYSVAAASVIAKVTRDRIMVELDTLYPGYGLAQHKGYPTKSHMDACAKLGPSAVHRRTFAPLKTWFPLETVAEAANGAANSGKGGAKAAAKKRKRTT